MAGEEGSAEMALAKSLAERIDEAFLAIAFGGAGVAATVSAFSAGAVASAFVAF